MIQSVKALLECRGFVPDRHRDIGTLHLEEYW
jgi:hypothetical protein